VIQKVKQETKSNIKETVKMKNGMNAILFILWMVGLIVSKGFWMTLFCIIPLVSWFVAIDFFLVKFNLL
jgi:hypothetical protein